MFLAFVLVLSDSEFPFPLSWLQLQPKTQPKLKTNSEHLLVVAENW